MAPRAASLRHVAIALLDRVAATAAACTRHVTRAARRLRSCSTVRSRASLFRAVGSPEEEEDEGLWRRSILMGEKCQPLAFSGVIYYDADGRRTDEIPTPRSPLRTPLGGLPSASQIAADDRHAGN